MTPRHASTDEDIARCYPAMAALRPHVRQEDFVALVRGLFEEGYRLAYLAPDDEVVAVAGYRVCTNLHLGRNLYVDDLSTLESDRSRGYGRRLLAWLEREAERLGCTCVRLDSGVQRERAHRFYFREGYAIAAYHFLKQRRE